MADSPPAPAAASPPPSVAVAPAPVNVKGAVTKPNVSTPESAPQAPHRPVAYGEPSLPKLGPAGGKMVKLKLNGREVEVPAGTNLIEAARAHGVNIPYYCYHPGLTPAGNCRMCLVEATNSKKPITACTTPVTDGLEILTDSDMAKKARAGVLELMLVNHPLDCPICDKSGECMLQDHTFAHGKDHSRMVEPKETKHTKDLGNDIHIWGNRCIVCTRCVRFCDEITGTGELCVVERGDHSVIDVFPGYPLQSSMSGNVVDICPVGALISKDFLYQARVWFQKKTDSLCTGCSRGCNIEVQTKDNKIKRLVPRHNPHVNDYWMCDHGRNDHEYVLGPARSLRYRLGAETRQAEAGRVIAKALGAAGGGNAVAILGSASQTNEEAYLLRRLAEALGVPAENLGALARPAGKEEVFKSGFRISSDKNPNRRGVEALLGGGVFDRAPAILERLRSGQLQAAIIVSDRPHVRLGDGPGETGLLDALSRMKQVVVIELEEGAALPAGALVVPATAFSEKDGTMINDQGRVQRLRPATELPRGILSEVELLQSALGALGKWDRTLPAGSLFKEIAPSLGLGSATFRELAQLGLVPGAEK